MSIGSTRYEIVTAVKPPGCFLAELRYGER